MQADEWNLLTICPPMFVISPTKDAVTQNHPDWLFLPSGLRRLKGFTPIFCSWMGVGPQFPFNCTACSLHGPNIPLGPEPGGERRQNKENHLTVRLGGRSHRQIPVHICKAAGIPYRRIDPTNTKCHFS